MRGRAGRFSLPAMPRADSPPDVHEPGLPPRVGHRFVLALAALGVLFAWVPGLGLLVSLVGLGFAVWALRHHLHPRASTWAIGLAVLGVILGAAFTGIYLAFSPERDTGEERRMYEAFDRQFDPPEPVEPGRALPPGPPRQPAPPAPPQGPPGAP